MADRAVLGADAHEPARHERRPRPPGRGRDHIAHRNRHHHARLHGGPRLPARHRRRQHLWPRPARPPRPRLRRGVCAAVPAHPVVLSSNRSGEPAAEAFMRAIPLLALAFLLLSRAAIAGEPPSYAAPPPTGDPKSTIISGILMIAKFTIISMPLMMVLLGSPVGGGAA